MRSSRHSDDEAARADAPAAANTASRDLTADETTKDDGRFSSLDGDVQAGAHRWRSIAFVVTAAVLWGTYGSFVTWVTGDMGMSQPTFILLRFLATSLPVLALIVLRDPGMLRVRRRDVWLFAANGLASIVFFTTCYTAAVSVTKIATAAALLYTAPAIVLVLSAVVFKERLTVRKIACVAVAVVGCALVSGLAGGFELTVQALLLGLGAGLGYALYSIFSRLILERGYSPYANVFYTFSIASVVYLVTCLFQGNLGQIITMPAATAAAVVCGLLTGAGAYVLYTTGLKGIEVSRASQLATIEPVVAAVLGVVLFGQALSAPELVGIALVVGSVVAMNARAPQAP